jgi:hypothetical protein
LNRAALVVLGFALEAHAQPVSIVQVTIDTDCRAAAQSEITVVLTVGEQTVRFPAQKDTDGFWRGKYVDKEHPNVRTFPADRAMASLRLNGLRTGCEASTPSENGAKEDIAAFTFGCKRRKVHDIAIQTDGPIKIDYRRWSALENCQNERDHGTFTAGTLQAIPDIWVPDEEVRLLLNWDKPNPLDPGLLVFSHDSTGTDFPLFSPDPTNPELFIFLDKRGHAHRQKVGDPLPLDLEFVVNTLANQRFKKRVDNAPNSRLANQERLKGKLKTLTLVVK